MTADAESAVARFVLMVDGSCGPWSTLGREVTGLADREAVPKVRAMPPEWIDAAGPGAGRCGGVPRIDALLYESRAPA